MAKATMTDNSRKVFGFLKENYGANLTNSDIAGALGVTGPTVVGSVNGLVKKGYAVRTEAEVAGADGKVVKVKYISLTAEGYAFDPDAAVESK